MRSHNRFTAAAAGAVVALALAAGCSSDDSSGENADACSSFETHHNELVALVDAGPGTAEELETWTAAKNEAAAQLEGLPEAATDTVAESMSTFVDGLPDETLDLSETDSASGQAFVANANAVASACEADGSAISLTELPLVSFGS